MSLCFRDMEFCTAACATKDCVRRLTNEVRIEARAWWGEDGAPIAMSDQSNRCGDFEPQLSPGWTE